MHHLIQILNDVIIGDAVDRKSLLFQELLSLSIGGPSPIVAPAIYLDHHSPFRTVEIDDVRADRPLAKDAYA